MRITDFLTQWRDYDKTYVKQGDSRSLSYRQMNRRAESYGAELANFSVRKSNVALIASNSLDFVVAYWSLLFAGATVVLVNRKTPEPELVRILEVCDCNWIVGPESAVQDLCLLADGAKVGLLVIEENKFNCLLKPRILKRSRNTSAVPLIFITSGTTDKPKAVMTSDENLVVNTQSHIEALKLAQADVVLNVLPVSFSYAHTSQFLCHTRLGGTVCFYDEPVFVARSFCRRIENDKVNITSLVPALLRILFSYRYLNAHNMASLRLLCCGGSPINADEARSLIVRLPCTRFVHTYGLTEASPRVASLAPEHDILKLPSIGKAIPGVEIRIVDAHGAAVGPSQVGELQVSGKNVMVGYYGSPAETRSVLQDGWLKTGDLASCDDQGYIFLKGRKKNLINSGGINISPEEIEFALAKLPGVREAFVKAEESDGMGQVPVAYLAMSGKQSLTIEEVHRLLKGKLAQWKWPQKVYLNSSFAKTETGKLRRSYGRY